MTYLEQAATRHGLRVCGQSQRSFPAQKLPLRVTVTGLDSMLHPWRCDIPGVVLRRRLEYLSCATDPVSSLVQWVCRDIISSVHTEHKVSGLHIIDPESGDIIVPSSSMDLGDLGEQLGIITPDTWVRWVDEPEIEMAVLVTFSSIVPAQ